MSKKDFTQPVSPNRGALLIKHPIDPNLTSLITLRETSSGTIPIAKITSFFWVNNKRFKKDWLTLRNLYYMQTLLTRIIHIMEEYYDGSLNLEKMLDTDIDFSLETEFTKE